MSKTWNDLVKEYFPLVSDEGIENILWKDTGYPCFWNIPEDGKTPIECAKKQLQELKDSKEVNNDRRTDN